MKKLRAIPDFEQRNGLDVEVKMGGPQVNVMQLLLAGQADLIMGYDLQTIKAIEQGLPVVTVAATFQKDPAVLIAHPGVAQLADLKSRTLLIGQASETTFWPWLKSKYGFTDAQKRPYAFSVQQFLVDQNVGGEGNVAAALTTTFVDEAVRGDHLAIDVGQDRKIQITALDHAGRLLRPIHADGQHATAELLNLMGHFAEPDELRNAQRSPEPAIKNKQDGTRGIGVTQPDGRSRMVGKGEVRRGG